MTELSPAQLAAEIHHFIRGYQQIQGLDPEFIYRIHLNSELEAALRISRLQQIAEYLKSLQEPEGPTDSDSNVDTYELRNARLPKPERSAEVALNLLDDVSGLLDAAHENGIRRALERLRELEGSNPKLPVSEPPPELVFEGKRYTRADLVSPEDKDWGKHVVIGGVEYFPL